MLFSVISLVAMAAAVTASPVGSSPPSKTASSSVETDPAEIRSHLHLGTAHGGALDLPKPTAPPSMDKMLVNASPDWWTISVYNRQPGSEITTVHVDGVKSPKPWGGKIPSGNIGEYGSSVFYIPKDYEGDFAFNKAGFSVSTGDESQIEFSYKDQYLDGNYYFDINVSYVFKQWILSTSFLCLRFVWQRDALDWMYKGPLEHELVPGNVGATQFFSPCHYPGGAYTYPEDNLANNMNGACSMSLVSCCIGTDCAQLDHGSK
ncbi:hypothetical protein NLG97_g4169 [Lecanicillium saksenae]|uniref:Uncharacterized protein n=1 Tax=Lecanicillium saksenae TaxID=468837 RepID=A0ACC1QYM7_9HYPO|nr:hypothetical protein NLG97_g4169 [Lecanicillium saksenae]